MPNTPPMLPKSCDRRFAVRMARPWNAATLLTSELVADAMIDTDAEPQLFIDAREGHVYVEVRATDSLRRLVEPLRTCGWALTLLNTVTSSWGIESRSDCRAVWFALNF